VTSALAMNNRFVARTSKLTHIIRNAMTFNLSLKGRSAELLASANNMRSK